MRWALGVVEMIRTWLRRAFGLGGASRVQPYVVVHVDDEPEELQPARLYAVGEAGHLWHMTMLCPCGCGEKIQLNALADAWPCWELSERAGGPTVVPSIWRRVGCKSHFFVRSGRIEWCHR